MKAISQKYEKPQTGIPASDLASGVIPTVPVQDVQVNGVSVLNQGVANVPVAGIGVFGVFKLNSMGIAVNNSGEAYIQKASSTDIKAGSPNYKAIVPNNQHESIFYGLAKLAGADMASLSGETVGVYPDAQKIAIQKMLGLWEPKLYLTGTVEEDSANIQLNFGGVSKPLNIWEELIIVIYQTISENGQTIGSNNAGYFTIKDNINAAYLPSANYLRGDRPNIYRIKRFPNVIFCEMIAGANIINTNSAIRATDYVDNISWISMAFSNGTIKAGTRVDAYIHRFI